MPQVDIIISNSSGKPIYEQIADQVKEQIMAGALAAGDALPSMRLLAKELRISVITTKRAYEELERDGFLENVPGKGCFVAPQNRELLREAQPVSYTHLDVYKRQPLNRIKPILPALQPLCGSMWVSGN